MSRTVDIDAMPYRPCVGVMLVNRDGLVFLGKRRKDDGPEHAPGAYAWQMPQGGIDEGEEPRQAAERELYEETGVRSIALLGEAPEWLVYDLPRHMVEQAWNGRYRGQTMRWFAYRFTGQEREIDIRRPGGGRHKPEFVDWRWGPVDQLTSLIVPFKRGVYEGVVAALGHLARPGSGPA